MNPLVIATIFSILGCISSANQTKCPDGKISNVRCGTQECLGICFSDLNAATPEWFCCRVPANKCVKTKLYTFQQSDSSTPLDPSLKEDYYLDPFINIACPYPFSYHTFPFSRDLPIGYVANDTSVVKVCKTNADCGTGAYCGEVRNPEFEGALDRSTNENNSLIQTRFCYAWPAEFSHITLQPLQPEVGLARCNVRDDCEPENFCIFLDDTTKFKFGADFKNGYCGSASLRETDLTNTSLTEDNDFCKTERDCSLKGNQTKAYKPRCLPLVDHKGGSQICIYDVRNCSLGRLRFPLEKCEKHEECNLNVTSSCEYGFCCSEEEISSTCPDGIIGLSTAPKCKNAVVWDFGSGTCEYNPDGAICFKGHCCSKMRDENGTIVLGDTAYKTHKRCRFNDMILPKMFYCYDGHIIIAGADAIEDTEQACKTNDDCSIDLTRVCVLNLKNKRVCMRNRMIKDPPSSLGFYIFLGFLLFGTLFIVIGVIWYKRRNADINNYIENIVKELKFSPTCIAIPTMPKETKRKWILLTVN